MGPLHFYHIAYKQTLWEALAPRELACRQGITPKDERKGKLGDTPYSCLYGEATSKGVHFSLKNGILKGKGLDLGVEPPRTRLR